MSPTQTIILALHPRSSRSKGNEPPFRCPITGGPCEGDLTHLCEDYGCARKAGFSPRSDDNF
jgi:hypothetical protein